MTASGVYVRRHGSAADTTGLPRTESYFGEPRATASPRRSGSHPSRGRRDPPRYCFPDGIGRTHKPRAIPVLNPWCPRG